MKHNFIESQPHGSQFQVVIYCTWCGKVVWHFNYIKSNDGYQARINEPCILATETKGKK